MMSKWTLKHHVLATAIAGAIFLGLQPAALAEEATTDKVTETTPGAAADNADANGDTTQKNAKPEKKLKITSEYIFTNNQVNGPGADSSSLSRGSHYSDVLNFDWNNKKDNKGLSLNFTLNINDDQTIDPTKLSLTNFVLNYESPTHNATLGDVMGSFSPYSMSGSVKGISYKYHDEVKDGPEISLIYGSQYARWDNFWDNNPDTQSTNRMVGAAHIKQALSDEFTMGFNLVKTHDRRSLINESGTRYDTNIVSTDFEYKPTPFWTYSGELAHSKSAQEVCDDSYTNKAGRAIRLSSVMEKGKTRFATEYELVTPDFLTQAGSAGADKEKLKVSWKDRLGLGSTYHATVYWDRNNLDGQLMASTQNINYETGVIFRRAFGREDGSLDISLVRNLSHDTDTADRLEKTLNFNYQDNIRGIDTNATVAYARTDSAGPAIQYNWSHNLTLSSNLVRGKTTIVPTLTIAHSKQAVSDESSRVMTREYALGATVNFPNGESLSLIGGWKNADYYSSLLDNSNSWFASFNWTFKPAFLKAWNASSMYIKVGINDYQYTTVSRNYRENSIATGVKCDF